MSLYRELAQARAAWTRPVVTIGNFDAAHLGHQALVAETRRLAEVAGVSAAALTFEPHPVRLFRPDAPPFLLVSLEERARLLVEGYGLDGVMALAFDRAMAGLSPEAFAAQVLVDGLGVSHVVVGEDFHFGAKRAGNGETLRALGEAMGFGVTVCAPVCVAGDVASSSRVREALRDGDVEAAAALLGRPHELVGRVVHGDARGRTMGYPTANVATTNPLLPRDGIYTSRLSVEGFGVLDAISYIGARPTFYGEEGLRVVETFVLRWDEARPLDLYDRDARVALLEFIRPDAAFTDAESLMAQMDADVAHARAYFARQTDDLVRQDTPR